MEGLQPWRLAELADRWTKGNVNLIGGNTFSQSWGQDHNRHVQKHLPVSKTGLETTGSWTKLVKLGLGKRSGFTIKPQVTIFLELIGTASETSKLPDSRPIPTKTKVAVSWGMHTNRNRHHDHWLCIQWKPSIWDTLWTILSVLIKGRGFTVLHLFCTVAILIRCLYK